MSKCECLEKCPFFNDRMKAMPATAEMYKSRYCLGDNSICARYLVFKKLGEEAVPVNLFPNNIEKAKEIIGE